jgi:hypothetical protein
LVAIVITHRRALQEGTSYRGRVAHVVGATADAVAAEEQESVAVVLHGRPAVTKERVPEGVLFFVNKGAAALWPDQQAIRRRGGKEGGLLIALDVAGEDAGEGVRQEEPFGWCPVLCTFCLICVQQDVVYVLCHVLIGEKSVKWVL